MTENVLEQVTALIESDPRSGQALSLYALCKTLDIEKSGHMYLLKKLVDMTAENRQLAYALMELMSQGKCREDDWARALVRMDTAIRG
ncbi:hypothetical protein MNBD_GAMMA25-2018 [hydrothermal vent metagenome]|uniref:Uncharacterized protein n=1 Tax=hydrothermal vent metagenome TaxID=652676 RepID=A0A3B1BFP3_9ZZZZ